MNYLCHDALGYFSFSHLIKNANRKTSKIRNRKTSILKSDPEKSGKKQKRKSDFEHVI